MPSTFGPYSPLRQAGELYFTSGQVGVDRTTKSAQADITGQTQVAIENLKTVLATAGLKLTDVVKATVFLTDMDEFAAMNVVYLAAFPEPRPARTCVAVAELPRVTNLPLKVEIEAVAMKREP